MCTNARDPSTSFMLLSTLVGLELAWKQMRTWKMGVVTLCLLQDLGPAFVRLEILHGRALLLFFNQSELVMRHKRGMGVFDWSVMYADDRIRELVWVHVTFPPRCGVPWLKSMTSPRGMDLN